VKSLRGMVCGILKIMNYTRKRLVVIPIERNCQRIFEQRTEFCRYVEHISDDNLIYLDEFGVNGHCVRSYGCSLKNSKAVTFLNANRGRNVSALVAISKNSIICYDVSAKPFNSHKFKDFITRKLFIIIKLTVYKNEIPCIIKRRVVVKNVNI